MQAALDFAMMPEIMQGSVCCQSQLRGGVCPACPARVLPWVHPQPFVLAVPEGQPSALQTRRHVVGAPREPGFEHRARGTAPCPARSTPAPAAQPLQPGAGDLFIVRGVVSPTSTTTIQKLSTHFPSRPLRPSPNSFNSALWRTNLCPAQPRGSRLDPSVFPGLLAAVRELHAPPLRLPLELRSSH